MTAALVALVALLNSQTEAAPNPLVFESPDIQALAEPALAMISYPWQQRLPGWRVEFVRGESVIAGYTWSREDRIEVFVRKDSTTEDLARILAHELGHAVDVRMNDGDERRRWLELRGVPDAPWWPGEGVADFATGAGDFAESFAAWQVGPYDYRGELAPAPTAEEIAVLSELAQN